jgi:hypothetical protein
MSEWADKNELLLNRPKTVMTTFRKGGRRAATDKILYGEEPLEIVTEFKYLGMVFQMNGRNFMNHVRKSSICNSCFTRDKKSRPIINDDCYEAL